MWHRVFSPTAAEVPPHDLAEAMHREGLPAIPHFKGDLHGWTTGELHLPDGSVLLLARFLTAEDDLRDDLNAFAAELETCDYSPNAGMLMEKVIQTGQLITLRKPIAATDEASIDRLVEFICRYLATRCEGFYQIDGRGWFSADGGLLVQEY